MKTLFNSLVIVEIRYFNLIEVYAAIRYRPVLKRNRVDGFDPKLGTECAQLRNLLCGKATEPITQ